MGDRRPLGTWALAGAICLAAANPAWAGSDYLDLFNKVFGPSCFAGCHNRDQNGGMKVQTDDARGFYNVVVNQPAIRSGSGKLRVHPFHPELSFLRDKVRGEVRAAEGDAMPRGQGNATYGLVYIAPGYVDAIEKWIAAGAPGCTNWNDPGTCPDFMTSSINSQDAPDKPQPAFNPPTAPGGALPLDGDDFEVSSLAAVSPQVREGSKESTLATTSSASYVTKIEIYATAGTQSVELYRDGDTAPIAVARGESLSLDLPEGVGVPIGENQSFRIVQRIANEYFVAPGDPGYGEASGRYHNLTRGDVRVYLTTAASVDAEAQPLLDTTGTDLLFVTPRRAGVTGGVWAGAPGETISGALVGLWTDRRAIAVALVDPATQSAAVEAGILESEPLLVNDYAPVSGSLAIAYSCVHNNGLTHVPDRDVAFATTLANETVAPILAPVRTACQTDANLPSGLPAILDMPDETCWRDHDPSPDNPKTLTSVGSDCAAGACRPANLVGGEGIDEGRCNLVGLYW